MDSASERGTFPMRLTLFAPFNGLAFHIESS